jgi:hypothetical protein
MSTHTSAALGTDFQPASATVVAALTDALDRVHLPGSARYGELTVTTNATKAVRPLAVVEATGPADVSLTLRVAASAGVPVAVASTGHGATETMEDAVLVHTGALDELTVHADERWARVGAGVRWAAVLAACAPHGLAGLCGSSPDVGVVGFLTGGGVGPVVRSHGLSSDSVRAFDVVTGDGVVRRASATENPDLFWGLRGGKGSLGIVTAVEIDLADQATIYGGAIWYDGADATAVLRTWSVWTDLLPEQGTTSVAVMRLPDLDLFPEPLRGRTTVSLRFAWTGDPAVGEEMIRAMRSVATPLIDTVAVLPYSALGAVHSDPDGSMPVHEASLLLEDFGPDTADRLVELVGPQAESVLAMVEVRQLGGRLRTGPDCAFAHRDAAYQVFTIGLMIPEIAQLVVAETGRVGAELSPWASAGGLPNFTDTAGAAWAARVYSPVVAERLGELSRRYDPAGVLLAARGVRQ